MSFVGIARKFSPFSLPGRLIRLPLRLIPSNAVVRILTGVNRGYRWIVGSATHALWIGSFEFDHGAAMEALVRPGMVAYDIGANVGYYTLALSRLVGETGHVYAFEPEARNCHLLLRHIEMNHLRNVTLVQLAVSDKPGMVGFQSSRSTSKISSDSSYLVPAISLDEFVRLGHPGPSIIKMDIEGAERTALSGAGSLLAKGEATWIMATHSDQLRDDCREFMARSGYRFAAFDGVSDPGTNGDFLAFPPRSISAAGGDLKRRPS